jgi:hypothetical protein
MKKLHEILHQSAREHEEAFRSHLFEKLVLEQLSLGNENTNRASHVDNVTNSSSFTFSAEEVKTRRNELELK